MSSCDAPRSNSASAMATHQGLAPARAQERPRDTAVFAQPTKNPLWTSLPDGRPSTLLLDNGPSAPPKERGPTRSRLAIMVLAHAGWISVLSGWAVYRVGRFGFSPTDDGFVLGLSWRILHGEIPHLDVVSARPLGSALLHTVDFLLPGPLFVASQAFAMVEIVLMTIALTALVTARAVTRWGPTLTGVVAAAALVNLHTFSLGAWHTIDGLAATACGWWALDAGLRSGRTGLHRTGLFLLGFAALTKQSFALAALVGLAMLVAHPAVRAKGQRWGGRTAVVDLVWLGAAPLVYVLVVTAAGGLPDLVGQLGGATPTAAQRLFAAWTTAPSDLLELGLVPLVLCTGALFLTRLACRRASGPTGAAQWVDLALVLGAGMLAARILVAGELARAGDWGIELFWLLLLSCGVFVVSARRVPWRGLLVAVLAWMCSLSWGYDSPTLLGGTLVVTSLYLLVVDAPWLPAVRRRPRMRAFPVTAATGLVAVLFAGFLLTSAHDRSPYRDRPQGELTSELGGAAPNMRGIRSTVGTSRYVEQIRDCVRRHPAARVAVLPDNAFVYPVLGLRNPFPLDWPLPIELVADARQRMLGTVERLNRSGDFLVLFQTIGWQTLAAGTPPPAAVSTKAQHAHYGDLEGIIRSRLSGKRISCGSFVGIWASRN